jgi:hypothetical protein
MSDEARPDPPDGVTRREILKRAAIAGGVAWAAPAIKSITTPAFAQTTPQCIAGCFWVKLDENGVCDDAGSRFCPDCTGAFPVPRSPGGCPCVENAVTMQPCSDPATGTWTLTLPPNCTFHGGYSKCGGPQDQLCEPAIDNGDGTVTFLSCKDPPGADKCISHIEFCYCCT